MSSAVGFGIVLIFAFAWMLAAIWQPTNGVAVPIYKRLISSLLCLALILVGGVLIQIGLMLSK